MTDLQQSDTSFAGYGSALRMSMLRDAQAWTGLQCELLSGMEALWAEWGRRQSEAIENSARMLHRLYDGSGLIELGQIQRDWFAGAARRSAAAIGRWAGESAAATQEAAALADARLAAANESAAPGLAEREAAE